MLLINLILRAHISLTTLVATLKVLSGLAFFLQPLEQATGKLRRASYPARVLSGNTDSASELCRCQTLGGWTLKHGLLDYTDVRLGIDIGGVILRSLQGETRRKTLDGSSARAQLAEDKGVLNWLLNVYEAGHYIWPTTVKRLLGWYLSLSRGTHWLSCGCIERKLPLRN